MLFRSEAVEAQRTSCLGDVVLVRPISFTYMACAAMAVASLILTVLIFGAYTKHSTVSGQLIPDSGLVKIYSPQTGVVVQKNVTEGDLVRRGDVLYVLSSERQSASHGGVQASISRQVEARQSSLREEMLKTQRLQESEASAAHKKVELLNVEISKIAGQIEVQKNRVKLAEEAAGRSLELLGQHYISKDQLQQKQADALEQVGRLKTLERDSINVSRELSAQQTELSMLPLRHQNQLAQIERTLMSTNQEHSESEAKRRLEITASESGIATAISAEIGQSIDSTRPVVSIVPSGASLQAHLFAPSKTIGFVRAGATVLLRYQAFPYQKFGNARGTVLSVSKTALPGNELTAYVGAAMNSSAINSEPLYLITVKLDSQSVKAYGKAQPLQAGMLLEADLLQESRKLYEWALEPLYSLTGKI